MDPRIVFVTQFPVAAKSAEFREAMAGAEYLVGYVE
jgi:hypothetical protein